MDERGCMEDVGSVSCCTFFSLDLASPSSVDFGFPGDNSWKEGYGFFS